MKEHIKNMIVELSVEDIIEITNELNDLCKIINRAKDTIFIRYIALRGYSTKNNFMKIHKIKHDGSIDKVITGHGDSIKSFLELKKLLNIPDTVFYRTLEKKFIELGGDE